MKLLRISANQVINAENINRFEVYEAQDIRYITIVFVGGESYRCTEEESVVFLQHMRGLVEGTPSNGG